MDPETAAMFQALMGGSRGGPSGSPMASGSDPLGLNLPTPNQDPLANFPPSGLDTLGLGVPTMPTDSVGAPPMPGASPDPSPQPMAPPPPPMWQNSGGAPGVDDLGNVDPRIMDPAMVAAMGWAGAQPPGGS